MFSGAWLSSSMLSMLCARSAIIRRIVELKDVVTMPLYPCVRCVHRLEKKAGVLLCHFPHDTGFPNWMWTRLAARIHQGSSCLCLPKLWGHRHMRPHPGFPVLVREPDSGPQDPPRPCSYSLNHFSSSHTDVFQNYILKFKILRFTAFIICVWGVCLHVCLCPVYPVTGAVSWYAGC